MLVDVSFVHKVQVPVVQVVRMIAVSHFGVRTIGAVFVLVAGVLFVFHGSSIYEHPRFGKRAAGTLR